MRDWILVTGFGAFGEVGLNPTQVLVEGMEHLTFDNVDLVRAVFDVSFERASVQLKELMKHRKTPPAAAIHFGVASSSVRIRIEERAVNCKRGIDVDGASFDGTSIDGRYGTDEFLKTKLDVPLLVQVLNEQGFPSRESQDAGRYVCNSTYFHSLQYTQAQKPSPLTLFVHVPSIGNVFQENEKRTEWTDELLLKSAECIIQWFLKEHLDAS